MARPTRAPSTGATGEAAWSARQRLLHTEPSAQARSHVGYVTNPFRSWHDSVVRSGGDRSGTRRDPEKAKGLVWMAREVSESERWARREEGRPRSQAAVEAQLSSEGWRRWLAVRRHFHAYSLGNQLLNALQRPEATRVAGFRAWLKLGYCVRRGEKALRVWVPMPPSGADLEAWRAAGSLPGEKPRTLLSSATSCSTRAASRRGSRTARRAGRGVGGVHGLQRGGPGHERLLHPPTAPRGPSRGA